MTPPTDREMLREKLECMAIEVLWPGFNRHHDAKLIVGIALAEFDCYLGEYEPLRKKLPRFVVQICSTKAFVINGTSGNAAEFHFDRCPNAEAEARSLAEKLNAADRKEK